MAVWIALFKGINVGGNHILPMKELAALLEREGGLTGVRTYIQSGNVVFQSPKKISASALGKRIGELVMKRFGFQPAVLVLTAQELEKAAAANPFPQAAADPKSLHLFFLCESPVRPDLESLSALKTGREAFALKGKVFYLYTPDGFARCKVAEKVGRFIKVDMTARNWRTVGKLLEMAKAAESGGA